MSEEMQRQVDECYRQRREQIRDRAAAEQDKQREAEVQAELEQRRKQA